LLLLKSLVFLVSCDPRHYDLSTPNVYMGSINYSNASMTQNRELGVYITDPTSVQALYADMTSDYAGASPY
jgi:cardiolipin synthase